MKIGIRREDKNEWERRVPLIPKDIRDLCDKEGLDILIQPSKIRAFKDDEYRKSGALVSESLRDARVIFAVKEIPAELIEEGKTYIFFSHTIKGQPYNRHLLRTMIEKRVNLIDYERIVDENGKRLIFFGKYAGLAGMIETLYALGQKLKLQGYNTPLERIRQPFEYRSVESAKKEIKKIGDEIESGGFEMDLSPFVFGFAGYGNVSRGAQEIFDLLPYKIASINILEENYENFASDNHCFYKVIFKEEDMVKPLQGTFDLKDYYKNPGNYVSVFNNYISKIRVLVNCIYWTEEYPRLVTKEYLQNEAVIRSYPTLKVIGDISCDINGSIEITEKVTMPDNPTFTYLPSEDKIINGITREGVSVMAVDNLPCEFPAESSGEFSSVLKKYVSEIVNADFKSDYSELALSYPIKKGLILHDGNFTPGYEYMKKFI